jgi:hypothetical protein
MGRNGRQQLLKPNRFKDRPRRRGQAIVELLPAVVIFFAVIVAALNYFRVMRAAVIRQEAVRNAVFSVIHNSGTLTTPPNLLQQVANKGGTNVRNAGTVEAGRAAFPVIGGHSFVGGAATCFRIYPTDPIREVETPLLSFFAGGAAGGTPSVSFMTYAVVSRAGGNCAD